ncbi:hypothetical protein [Arthrobacter sp. HLT1-20]
MDTAQIIITVLGAGTGGAILTSLVNGLIKYWTGTAGRERARNADMRTQRNEAWADAERERNRADREARNRNRLADYASGRRRDLIERGVEPADIAGWPQLETEPSATPPGG